MIFSYTVFALIIISESVKGEELGQGLGQEAGQGQEEAELGLLIILKKKK